MNGAEVQSRFLYSIPLAPPEMLAAQRFGIRDDNDNRRLNLPREPGSLRPGRSSGVNEGGRNNEYDRRSRNSHGNPLEMANFVGRYAIDFSNNTVAKGPMNREAIDFFNNTVDNMYMVYRERPPHFFSHSERDACSDDNRERSRSVSPRRGVEGAFGNRGSHKDYQHGSPHRGHEDYREQNGDQDRNQRGNQNGDLYDQSWERD